MRHALAVLSLFPALAGPAAADPAIGGALAVPPRAAADEEVGFHGCGSHAAVTRWLSGSFAEAPAVRGVQGDGHLFEVYMAKRGATWTVVVTSPAGESCIVNEGTSLEVLTPAGDGPVA